MDSSANTEIDSTGTNGVQASQYINPGNKISTVKLTDENFLLWKFQVLTTLEGHGLESYIECDDDPPPKLIQIADVLTKPLSAVNFNRLKFKLNVWDPSSIGLQQGVLRQYSLTWHLMWSYYLS
ncbi:uncharacterized protein LOC111017341 isoform X1 [Momordica charantia]|uniref:Uncharacterized protein LOC111017341 isoform X1 n=1 Tax=Momordica charantia TaxID=3673 RepID=A0A6J1D4X2_MOMCH|nr:uncharacterized protein LOC111017341 isoform X1 [Momordica charantia]